MSLTSGFRFGLPPVRPWYWLAGLASMPRTWAVVRWNTEAQLAILAALALKPERVFRDVADIAAQFGGAGANIAIGRVPGLRAEANRGEGAPKVIVAELPVPHSRTFAMMRAVGDLLAFQQEGRSPVTDTYSYRQAVGRAFAVEMLAPAGTILQMERDGWAPDEIAMARNV